MNKLFIIALMTGFFGVQSLSAQNYIEVTTLTQGDGSYIVLASEDTKTDESSLCYNDSNWSGTTTVKYSWDGSVLTIEGGASEGTYTITDQNTIDDYDTAFAAKQNLVVSSDAGFTSATAIVGTINGSGTYVAQ